MLAVVALVALPARIAFLVFLTAVIHNWEAVLVTVFLLLNEPFELVLVGGLTAAVTITFTVASVITFT
jgi:hypothetical protein